MAFRRNAAARKRSDRRIRVVPAPSQDARAQRNFGDTGAGGRYGLFALLLTRPDRSDRVFWRQAPSEIDLKEPSLEVVLPENATLTKLARDLVHPGALSSLMERGHTGFEGVVRILRRGESNSNQEAHPPGAVHHSVGATWIGRCHCGSGRERR